MRYTAAGLMLEPQWSWGDIKLYFSSPDSILQSFQERELHVAPIAMFVVSFHPVRYPDKQSAMVRKSV